MHDVQIERAESITDDVRSLIFELDNMLAVAYPPEQMHGLTLRSLFEPHVQFFIARLDGRAAGCCGVAANVRARGGAGRGHRAALAGPH
jgi:putative acetyltransferase